MTSPTVFPLDAQTVRDYLSLATDSTSRYTDTTIGSNIRASLGMLERLTHRRLGGRTETLTFSSYGNDMVTIPGLRTATSVTRSGATLTSGASYYLHPDSHQTGLSTAVSFGQNSYRVGRSYLSNPEWFDRNLDSWRYQYLGDALPNDLVITGSWGFLSADMPDEVLMAVKVLAAYLTKLADANMAGFLSTPDGNAFDLSAFPAVVADFVRDWSLGSGVRGA